MADTFATPAELASWLQTESVDTASATLALESATAQIQLLCGQRFVSVSNETVNLRGGSYSVWLPERPVTAVGAVTTTAYGAITARTLGVEYRVIGAELRWLYGYGWPELVTVTYSHGYATIPAGLKAVCLSAAARIYQNPGSLRSESVGSVSWMAAGAAVDVGPGLTEVEKATLAPYRPGLVV